MCVQKDGVIIDTAQTILGVSVSPGDIQDPICRRLYTRIRRRWSRLASCAKFPDTRIIPQANRVCGPVGYAPYALPGSEALGANIAATFAEGYNIVILENHGMAGGATFARRLPTPETLDFCARTLIRARSLGDVHALPEPALNLFDHRHNVPPEFVPTTHSSAERELRQQIAEITARAL